MSKLNYDPADPLLVSFAAAVPEFVAGDDNPRDFLERCLAQIEAREELIVPTLRSQEMRQVRESLDGHSPLAGAFDDAIDGIDALVDPETNILNVSWIKGYEGKLKVVFGSRERNDDQAQGQGEPGGAARSLEPEPLCDGAGDAVDVGEIDEGGDGHYIWTHKKFDIGFNGKQIVDVNLTSEAKVKLTPNIKIPFTYEVTVTFY